MRKIKKVTQNSRETATYPYLVGVSSFFYYYTPNRKH